MEDLSEKFDLWGVDRVVLFDLKVELEPTFLVGCVRGTSNVPLPVVEDVLHRLQNEVLVLRARDL